MIYYTDTAIISPLKYSWIGTTCILNPLEEIKWQLYITRYREQYNIETRMYLLFWIIKYTNKEIRNGKYLAPSHASAWQRSPH